MPSVRTPSSQAELDVARRGRSAAPGAPSRSATSTRRSELELFGAPITSTASQCRGDLLDRRLPVRGGVADVLAARRPDAGKAALEHGDDLRRVVDRQRRLGEEGELVRIGAAATVSASAAVSIRVIRPSGTWPNVPITSGWPAWPMNRMWRPRSTSRSAWRWTLETSGQVASR